MGRPFFAMPGGGSKKPKAKPKAKPKLKPRPAALGLSDSNIDEWTEAQWDRLSHGKTPATAAQHASRPLALFMAGGPGSGKSTIRRIILEGIDVLDGQHSGNIIIIDPDELKEHHEEYQRLLALGDAGAAAAVHEHTSRAAKTIFWRGVERHYSLLYDATMSDFLKNSDLLRYAQNHGYEVSLQVTLTSPNIAKRRADLRAQRSGRVVPSAVFWGSHAGFLRNLTQYLVFPYVDWVRVYDNSMSVEGHVLTLDLTAPRIWASLVRDYIFEAENGLRSSSG